MVTVSVMAVVGGVVAFNIRQQAPAFRLEQAQSQIMSDLRLARMESVSHGVDAQFTFNPYSKSYTIWTDLNRNGSVDGGESRTKSLAHLPGISFSTYPSSGSFKPNGTFSSAYYYLYVSLNSAAGYRYVYAFPSGQVDTWSGG